MPISTEQLVKKTLELGASVAGVTSVESMADSRSENFVNQHGFYAGDMESASKVLVVEQVWRSRAKSLLVFAVAHPRERPELDWWGKEIAGGTKGNAALIDINKSLVTWLDKFDIQAFDVGYHPLKGGLYVKDAAVLAGLGTVGRNNLFLIPGLRAHHRLRCLAVAKELEPSQPSLYEPCQNCAAPCLRACPQKAFSDQNTIEEKAFPKGGYKSDLCGLQMQEDKKTAAEKKYPQTRYCRRCEFACTAE
ncbi:MAG: hypothetical protein GQ542_00805 [Desulforhopalus sp.]|nr:hypothetical protein [Desulforhopalus sp.]